jgi:N6-L-threonylcarbamoyladenine synthase
MITLGIETSCDETSMCILKDRQILSLCTHSQIDLHKIYGGVVPEIASRDHLAKINKVYKTAVSDAGIECGDINLVTYTAQPGLAGSLLTGIMFARGLALSLGVSSVAVNHIYGHIFTCGLTHGIYDDFLCLLVSGGHTAIYDVKNINNITKLGSSIDDSFGEVFDKLSKALGFGYPGGAIIEEIASYGNANAHRMNIPLKGRSDFNFSLSGIKTEFLKLIQKIGSIPPYGVVLSHIKTVPRGTNGDVAFQVADICASFQMVTVSIVIDRLINVFKGDKYSKLVLCGGVASNKYIRTAIAGLCKKNGVEFYVPDVHLCTDNAAMIANVGVLMHRSGV